MSELPWDEHDHVDIVKVEEGETGKRRNQQLTNDRLEAIARWCSTPVKQRGRDDVPATVLDLAKKIECSPASVRRWMKDARMQKRIDYHLRVMANNSMADVLQGQIAKATDDQDTHAAKFVDSVRRDPAERGHGTQVNVGVAIRTGTESNEDFVTRFQASIGMGILRQMAATPAAPEPIDVEDEEETDDVEA